MNPASAPLPTGSLPHSRSVAGFRLKLLIAMMVVVTGVMALAAYVAERNLAANINRELQNDFAAKLAALHNAQAIRHAALIERCHALVRKPRIHAALEDDALDLLYPSAEDELRDVMVPDAADAGGANHVPTLRARFYRFLDRNGRIIPPPAGAPIGALPPAVEAQLALPSLNDAQQLGYVAVPGSPDDPVAEIITTPIISTETGEIIAALALGFKPLGLVGERQFRSGVWTAGTLHVPGLAPAVSTQVASAVGRAAARDDEGSLRLELGDAPYLVFFQRLNPGSLYSPAVEVSLYPLEQFAARTTGVRLRILGVGILLLVGAFFASGFLAARLSAPVEQLAIESERSARFSADASHQLKTPVTVLRAGLEELLARENLTPAECDAIAALIHQTYRLSSLIEDLLLLSRMDSGRLKLALAPVDLRLLLDAALDDLGATPDALGLEIETDIPPALHVSGERRYTAIILHNLLENARKYNRPGGRIRVAARVEDGTVALSIANTGRSIAPAAQAHIFERFHRGAMGEDVPGYGLGLNLARELARLHGGDLRLVRSDGEWTEFEVGFRVAQPQPVPA
ncbi:MAG TPA: HAMP domain-containing sensor histidine kinase [Opitutaceae bacterium]|nr:HAMP domain-containing sensor histidine kinase [Opitutaceae bacterium]